MNFLLLGDVCGKSGMNAIKSKLKNIITTYKINFTIINGENAADNGKGLTKENFNDLIYAGADVVTTGNHVWDHKEIIETIEKEVQLIRPENFIEGLPGKGFHIFHSKEKKKIAVINLIGNVFMKKSRDVFESAEKVINRIKLKTDADFIFVDIHGEITSEKMALGHFLDGKITGLVGTHTHVPTSDTKILENGTAYQTDLGMCGDYNSVIGMNKANSIKKFLKNSNALQHFPAEGEATICGVIIEADTKTGLAKNIKQIILGGDLKSR
jgi:metallophosphoesterase (TIGR00282 family)